MKKLSNQQNVAIIYSPTSLRHYRTKALEEGETYTFSGARGPVTWLKGEYAYLSANGAESFLRRLGIKYDILADNTLNIRLLAQYHTLIIPQAEKLQRHDVLRTWLKNPQHTLIVAGRTNLPASVLGAQAERYETFTHHTGILMRNIPRLFGFKDQSVNRIKPGKKTSIIAELGEYVDVHIPLCKPLGIPAITRYKNVLYFAQPIFEFIGALLQGHIDFEDIRHLYPSYLFIDELMLVLKHILVEHVPKLFEVRVRIWGENDTAVVFRHDVDFSTDHAYPDYELQHRLPATYALLLDENLETWLDMLRDKEAEISYHYSTAAPPNAFTKVRIILARLRGDMHWGAAFPGKKLVTRKGLLQQITQAEEQGITCETAQRHERFFFYPETVDAMDYLYQEKPILGLGTMFRYECHQYGKHAFTVAHPETSVPFWFPFKLWYASTEHHHALGGWDSTHLMEPDPMQVEAVLSSRLENGAFTLGYHPQHAKSKDFTAFGNFAWFQAAIRVVQRRKCTVMTCVDMYRRMGQYEALNVSFDGKMLHLTNTAETPVDRMCIVIQDKKYPVQLAARETKHVQVQQ